MLSIGWSEPAATNAPVGACSTRFANEHPPCPSGSFFSPPLCPEIIYLPPTSPLLPTTYQPHPPFTPSPELQRPRAAGARARAVAVERELEWLEPEQDPHAHEEVRCLPFFFCFFMFVLFEEGNVALQRSVAKPSSYFLFATQEKKNNG